MAQKQVLGKGLASLFPGIGVPPAVAAGGSPEVDRAPAPSVDPAQAMLNKDRHPGISMAAVEEIAVNPYQPRKDFDEAALAELAESIRKNGIIQPLVVRKENNAYQLIAGERRLRAARLAGLKMVPIVIRRSTDRESLELAIIENVQREDLNCIDAALAYQQLLHDFSLTQEEVAARVGKDRASIANHLRLLRLPPAVMEDLRAEKLTFGHGKALASLEEATQILQAREAILKDGLSVRDAEALVAQLRENGSEGSAANGAASATPTVEETPLRSRMNALAQQLTRTWSTRVDVKGSDRRGKIVVHYRSRQDLDRLLGAMQNPSIWQSPT